MERKKTTGKTVAYRGIKGSKTAEDTQKGSVVLNMSHNSKTALHASNTS